MLQIHQLNMVLLLSPKYTSSKFSGFLVAKKTETPYLRAFPAFFHYSSSSMLTTCCVTRFAVLQDIGIILSGIEENNHIFCGFLSLNYPWDKKYKHLLISCFTGIITRFIWSFILSLFGLLFCQHNFF